MLICHREESSGSDELTEFISRYVEVHAPGNPQTLMTSYAANGSITRENVEGRVRQLALEESRKGGSEVRYRRILDFVKEEGLEGRAALTMADRTASWLFKAMKTKVWR